MLEEKSEKIRPLDLKEEAKPLAPKLQFHFKPNWKLIGVGMMIVVFGALSGFGLSLLTKPSDLTADGAPVSAESIGGRKVKVGENYGSEDDIFKDSAIGVIEANGVEGGEGTHKLLREGGDSQTAYLTSSIVDLNLFINRKVEVWGETFAAQKAGWLLDVGRVKVLE